MSGTAVLAAVAVLLGMLGARELLAVRAGRSLELPFGIERRSAVAALRLGLPARLRRAGLEERLPLAAVLAAKLTGVLVGGLAGLLIAPAAPGRMALLVAIGMPAAGFLAPDALLEREARRRSQRLVATLPDALDLLAVSAASGRGPAAGLAEIAMAGEGPLATELKLTAAELACGVPLSVALDGLRERVPGGELAGAVATIERSRRLGSPLADQLHRRAAALRRQARRATEERAARAAPKIQLVVALVLVPSVLLTIAAALIANVGSLLAGF